MFGKRAAIMMMAAVLVITSAAYADYYDTAPVEMKGNETLDEPGTGNWTKSPVMGKSDLILIKSEKNLKASYAQIKDAVHDGTRLEIVFGKNPLSKPNEPKFKYEVYVDVFGRKGNKADLKTYLVAGDWKGGGGGAVGGVATPWAAEVKEIAIAWRLVLETIPQTWELRKQHSARAFAISAYNGDGNPVADVAVKLTVSQDGTTNLPIDWGNSDYSRKTGQDGRIIFTGCLPDATSDTASQYVLKFEAQNPQYEPIIVKIKMANAQWVENQEYKGFFAAVDWECSGVSATPVLVVGKGVLSQASRIKIAPATTELTIYSLPNAQVQTATANDGDVTKFMGLNEGISLAAAKKDNDIWGLLGISVKVPVTRKIRFICVTDQNNNDIGSVTAAQAQAAIDTMNDKIWGSQAQIIFAKLLDPTVTVKLKKALPSQTVDGYSQAIFKATEYLDDASAAILKGRKKGEIFVVVANLAQGPGGKGSPGFPLLVVRQDFARAAGDWPGSVVAHEAGHAMGLLANDHEADYVFPGDVMGAGVTLNQPAPLQLRIEQVYKAWAGMVTIP